MMYNHELYLYQLTKVRRYLCATFSPTKTYIPYLILTTSKLLFLLVAVTGSPRTEGLSRCLNHGEVIRKINAA